MTDKPFLDRLTPGDREEVVRRLSRRTLDNDETILEQEDESADVYFVLEGVARAELRSLKGRTVAYREIDAGSVFGEIAGIDGGPRSASVVASGRVTVGSLSRAAFLDLLEARPGFARVLLEHLATQSRGMTDRIFRYAVLVIRERLISELLRMAQPIPNAENMAEIRPALRHQDLAEWITCHREAVTREMSNLKKLGFVDYSDGAGAITLRDVEALRTLLAETDG